jgi:hypothetical protein
VGPNIRQGLKDQFVPTISVGKLHIFALIIIITLNLQGPLLLRMIKVQPMEAVNPICLFIT